MSLGHQVGVITAAEKGEDEWRGRVVDGMHVWRLHFPRPYPYWDHAKASKWLKPLWYLQDHFDPRNRALMASVLDEFRPDCVQIHAPAGIGFNSLREIGRRSIPTVYYMHDLNLTCLWGGMFKNQHTCSVQCKKCRVVSRIRFANVTTIPRVVFCSPSHGNLRKASLFLPLDAPAAKLPPLRYGGKYMTTVIPAGVDVTEFQPDPDARMRIRAEFGVPAASRLLLFAARDFEHKGMAYVAEALDHLDDVFLLAVGPCDPSYLSRLRTNRRDRILFAGPRRDMPALFAAADVFVLPSRYETLSLVCLEAMATGVPVFATRVHGIEEYLQDGVNGYAIERDPADIARKIGPVLRDEARLQALSRGALSTARKFAWNIIVRYHEELLLKAIALQAQAHAEHLSPADV